MKNLLFLLLFPFLIKGQTKTFEGKVTNETGELLSFATVVINKSKLNEQIVTTDFEGIFHFKNIENDSIILDVTYVGYLKYRRIFNIDELKKQLNIVLLREEHELNELIIKRKKPLIKRKIDRLEFDVENSTLSSLSGWEILKQTPGITTQGSSLKIKGSQGILVTINDKKVMLTGDELQSLLENTPGKDIKSIEVITNPPANYDASGSAVLNIKMVKNNLEGYRGVLYGRYIQSKYDKEVFGLSQYYKKGKLSLMGSYYLGMGTYLREGFDVVNFVEDKTTWESKMTRKDTDKSQNSYTFNMEYDLDSLTNFTFGANGYTSLKGEGIYNVPTLIYNQDREIESNYNTRNEHTNATDYHNFYLQADKKWGNGNQIIWTNYLTNNHKNKFQNVHTQLNFKEQEPSESTFESDNASKVKLFSTQLDYSLKRTTWNWDSGLKYSTVKTNSTLNFFDDEYGTLAFRPEKSNIFNYKEDNFAAYTTVAYKWEKWSFKGGLRAEYTDLTGDVSQPKEHNQQNYLKWFPTLYAQYETENHHQFGISYGKRIDRPSYSWLNPAKSYYNLFSYFQGDAQLKATIIHNLNLTYSWNNWNVDLYFRNEKLPSMEISFQDPETNNLIYHYTNIKEGKAGGIDISKNFDLYSWWTLNTYLSTEYNENYFFGVDKELYKNNIWMFYGKTSSNFLLDKETDWNMEIGYYYRTPTIQGTFTISKESSTYFVMNKKFSAKKIEASIQFSDIFKTEKSKISTNYANQNNYFLDYRDTQRVSISLKYNFGNQTIKTKRNIKKTEEQDRI